MPWVRDDLCTGCGVCISECPVDAIGLEEGLAKIDNGTCIRCRVCHDVCPSEAVRFDDERIPQAVEENLSRARGMLSHEYYAGKPEELEKLRKRLEHEFSRDMEIARRTLERLPELYEE